MRLWRNRPVVTKRTHASGSLVGPDEAWKRKQELAKPARFYGDGGTIHGTGHLDVEVDDAGQVVAVWFRCLMLPFKQTDVEPARAREMRSVAVHLPQLTGVEVLDSEYQG